MVILIIALVAYACCGVLVYLAASLEQTLMEISVDDVHDIERHPTGRTPGAR
jgi:hypothetical protein